MRTATAIACAALLAGSLMRDAAAIVRCEDAQGRVTYSNTDCPPNTTAVRTIEPTPPVIVHGNSRPASKPAGAQEPAAKKPAQSRRAAEPVKEDAQLTAQLAEQRRECAARAREVQRLQEDLDTAPADSRASAELALRRAQDDYLGLCPRKR